MDPLGDVIDWISIYGICGLLAIGIAERFIPLLPSYGVLVAIGIAAAEGAWSAPAAIVATITGSVAGAVLLYAAARTVGEERSAKLLYWSGKPLGLSAQRIDRTVSAFRGRQRTVILVSQLIPTVRLITPLIAGLLQAQPSRFFVGTLIGVSAWNSLFVLAGYNASRVSPGSNASTLALTILILLVITETAVFLLWRHAGRWVSCAPASGGRR